MTPERSRQRVTEVFEAALREEPGQRTEFLRRVCADDARLLAEVSSLVAESSQLGDFMETPPLLETLSNSELSSPALQQIDRYRVIRELGRGAMGVVYEAVDPVIGRTIAVKTINLQGLPDPSGASLLRERLFREARSAGMLVHPGIVVVFDVGQQGDVAYIAMERIEGSTLEQTLASRERLNPVEVVAILHQTALALDYAHAKGVIHRDVKPSNIMITSGGQVKVADFGIAKITTTQAQTRTGMVMGTPSYMAPEQMRSQPVDGRSDQFSLAVMAFEMLTGTRPFQADSLASLVHMVVYEKCPSARAANPSLRSEVDTVLWRGLAKLCEERYASCSEFVVALEGALQGVPDLLCRTTVTKSEHPWFSIGHQRRQILAYAQQLVQLGQFNIAKAVVGGALALILAGSAYLLLRKPPISPKPVTNNSAPSASPSQRPGPTLSSAPTAAEKNAEIAPAPVAPVEKATRRKGEDGEPGAKKGESKFKMEHPKVVHD